MDASDVPPEATAIRLLKAQMAERTRELTSLLEISRDISSNLSIDSVLDEILDKLKTVVPFTNATIVRREGDMFFNVADHKLAGASPVRDIRFPASNLIDNRVMAARKPFIIQDVQHDETEEARDFRRQAADVLSTYYKDVRSWMRVPMIVKGEVVGMLTLHHDRPDFYTQHHADLALAFAENASVAMENARLFETLERRTTELASLLNVARTVTSTLDLGSLLTIVLD